MSAVLAGRASCQLWLLVHIIISISSISIIIKILLLLMIISIHVSSVGKGRQLLGIFWQQIAQLWLLGAPACPHFTIRSC